MCREASLRGRDVTSLMIKRRTKARLRVWIDGFTSNSRLCLALICPSFPLPLICIALTSPHCNNEPCNGISELQKINRAKDTKKTTKPRQKTKRKDEKKRLQQREKTKPKTKTKDQDQDKRRIE
jgi:hypothetical protein